MPDISGRHSLIRHQHRMASFRKKARFLSSQTILTWPLLSSFAPRPSPSLISRTNSPISTKNWTNWLASKSFSRFQTRNCAIDCAKRSSRWSCLNTPHFTRNILRYPSAKTPKSTSNIRPRKSLPFWRSSSIPPRSRDPDEEEEEGEDAVVVINQEASSFISV